MRGLSGLGRSGNAVGYFRLAGEFHSGGAIGFFPINSGGDVTIAVKDIVADLAAARVEVHTVDARVFSVSVDINCRHVGSRDGSARVVQPVLRRDCWWVWSVRWRLVRLREPESAVRN